MVSEGRVRSGSSRSPPGRRALVSGLRPRCGCGMATCATSWPRGPMRSAGGVNHGAADPEPAIQWLKRHGTKAHRDGLARFAIPTGYALGVTMGQIQTLAKQWGVITPWRRRYGSPSGWSADRRIRRRSAGVAAAQMDQWCRGFDNWAVCDTVCFALFDRTPHAWRKVTQWAGRKGEYQKRAAFALLWGLTVHDKSAPQAPSLEPQAPSPKPQASSLKPPSLLPAGGRSAPASSVPRRRSPDHPHSGSIPASSATPRSRATSSARTKSSASRRRADCSRLRASGRAGRVGEGSEYVVHTGPA